MIFDHILQNLSQNSGNFCKIHWLTAISSDFLQFEENFVKILQELAESVSFSCASLLRGNQRKKEENTGFMKC